MKNVSVVIPFYNRSDTVERAIGSLVSNKEFICQVIIVDDFSSCDHKEFLLDCVRSYDLPFCIVRNKTNIGAAASRNVGIDLAEGEYIAFLDSDDAWFDAKLKDQLFELGGCDFICSGFVKQFRNRMVPYFPQGGEVERNLILGKSHYQTSTFLLKSTLAKQIRFSEIPKFQDWDFIIKVQKSGASIIFHQKILVTYFTDAYERIGARSGCSYSDPFLALLKQYDVDAGLISRFSCQQMFNQLLLEKRYYDALKVLALITKDTQIAFSLKYRLWLNALVHFMRR